MGKKWEKRVQKGGKIGVKIKAKLQTIIHDEGK